MEIRYPGMVDEGKLTQTPLGRALERKRAEIQPKKFTNLTKAKVCSAGHLATTGSRRSFTAHADGRDRLAPSSPAEFMYA